MPSRTIQTATGRGDRHDGGARGIKPAPKNRTTAMPAKSWRGAARRTYDASRMDRSTGPSEIRRRALAGVAVGGAAEGIRSKRDDIPLGFFFRRCARLGHHL